MEMDDRRQRAPDSAFEPALDVAHLFVRSMSVTL